MTDLPLNADAKRPQFFETDGTDVLTSMILELMTEVWTVKERVYVLEEALSTETDSVKKRVELLTLTDEQQAELEASRSAFINNIMRVVETSKSRGVS